MWRDISQIREWSANSVKNANFISIGPCKIYYLFCKLSLFGPLRCRYHVCSSCGSGNLVDNRATRYKRNLSTSTISRAHLSCIHVFADDVSSLQHVPHSHVYSVRFQDSQNSGKFQRSQVHRFYHVFNVYRLVGIYSYLLRYQQRLQGKLTFVIVKMYSLTVA